MERMVQIDYPSILIVERDERVREFQQFFLERAGFCVVFADDGESALELARQCPPAAIVTEILVPKIDGLALCRRLGEDPLTREVPVVVFSMLAAASRAAEAGARAFVRKPLVESVFVAAVRDVLLPATPSNWRADEPRTDAGTPHGPAAARPGPGHDGPDELR